MLIQAAGLAVLAAITPTALLVSAVFLGSSNPRRTALFFLAGAIVMTVVVSVIIFFVLQAGHLQLPHRHKTRYGVRIGLGVLLLVAGTWMYRRSRQPHPAKAEKAKTKDKKKRPGVMSRLMADPRPRTAFLAGLFVYGPSVTFISAIQVVATSRSSAAESVGAIALVIVITVLFVWAPLILYFLAPERTTRLLERFNGWLRRHGRTLVLAVMLLAGIVLTVNGILGVTGAI